jgi:hypothetical protein
MPHTTTAMVGDEITDTLINFICADSPGCRAHE